jgi:hypothetical protein
MAGSGKVRLGWAWSGKAWVVSPSSDSHRKAGLGTVGQGRVWQVGVGPGRARHGSFSIIRFVPQGLAGRDKARQAGVWWGLARCGTASRGKAGVVPGGR